MAKLIDITGMAFGRLTVLRRSAGKSTRDKHHNAMWDCRCVCGTVGSYPGPNLRRGDTSSCGCLQRESLGSRQRTHGMSHLPEHRVWSRMIQRCHNPSDGSFRDYGGRGISVCDRWRDDFSNFYSDMGPRPSAAHSIERIENDGPYSQQNCKWATRREQSRNRRNIRKITFSGRSLCLSDWAIALGVTRSAIYSYIKRGEPPEAAIEKLHKRFHQ